MASRKTVEEMNNERRQAKARQNAVARAKAASRRDGDGEFSLADAIKDQRRREQRQQRSADNGQRLLEQLKRQGALRISEDGVSRKWLFDCRDVIAAAKADDERYYWNRDWYQSGGLNIAIKKSAPSERRAAD